jgi:hypothetical protein
VSALTDALTDAIQSHALATGLFERVNAHEPKSSPGNGLTAAVWAQSVFPVPAASGLTSTTGRIEFNVRIYQNMIAEPQDAIDPAMLAAVDELFALYSGDFTLGGSIRNVDLLGAHGAPMSAQAGYLEVGNGNYRIMTITLPLIVNDLWNQAE